MGTIQVNFILYKISYLIPMAMTSEVAGTAMLTFIYGGTHTQQVTKVMGLSGSNYLVRKSQTH